MAPRGAYDDPYFMLIPGVERVTMALMKGQDLDREKIALELDNRGTSCLRAISFMWGGRIARQELSWDFIDIGTSVSFWASNTLESL
jgi:hypothetical protein